MRLINVETSKLEEFFGEVVPAYAILSHTWGKDEEEVTFRDIENGSIKRAGIQPTKFEGCCKQAKKDGLKYIWIDTCCIDKTNSVELSEAINSMFQWYSKAFVCYAYLSDVPPRDNPHDPGSKFFSSRWFQRGWTLQELLAPKQVRFYNLAWTFLGTKSEMSVTIQKITGIPRPFLLGWAALHEASVAQRMSWAAKRVTKRKEDIAYCLLGIFGIVMPMIYGEGDQAFGRLQQEIIKSTRDDSILAWGLNPAESSLSNSKDVVSERVLATAPSDFENCGHIVSREQHTTLLNNFNISGGYLQAHLSLYTTSAGEIYGLLNCGPEQNREQGVGIPLDYVIPNRPSDEYVRPQGRSSLLLLKTAPSVSAKDIHIRIERHSRARAQISRRHWFYIEESIETNLEMIDVEPRTGWQKDRAMIATPSTFTRNNAQRSLARFRTRGQGPCDIVVVLELERNELQAQARCHVMTASRETALEDLSQRLIYLRPEVFGKQSANNGNLNIYVTVNQESVAGQPMFVVRLAVASSFQGVTIDATSELRALHLELKIVDILQDEEQVYLEAEKSSQRKEERMALLGQMKGKLAEVEEQLRKLSEEKRTLLDIIRTETLNITHIASIDNEVRHRQNKVSEHRLEMQNQLHEILNDSFDMSLGPHNWLEAIAQMILIAGSIGTNMKDDGGFVSDDSQLSKAAENRLHINAETAPSWAAHHGRKYFGKLAEKGTVASLKPWADNMTPLGWAASIGYKSVVQLLLEVGADMEAKDESGETPLLYAARYGHEAVVRMLLDKGAKLEVKSNSDWTPLFYAASYGHEAVVKLLLGHGADLETEDSIKGWTALRWAKIMKQETIAKLLLERGAKS